MSIELSAVRLMAPHFGDSAFVWTNVIGVLLVALAVGAWCGGQLAERPRALALTAVLLLIAGAWTAVVPLVAPAIGGFLLPQDLLLDAAMPAMVRGSLVASLLLFAPPVAVAGCITPVLVVALARHRPVGRACGVVAAASTLGSLTGTFATTHWLIPELGSRATLWIDAAILALAAALLRPSLPRAALCAVPLLLMPARDLPLRAPPADAVLLAEVESPYQFLRVLRRDADGGAVTTLKINEGLDSFHSIAIEGQPFTGGRYYDYHLAAALLAGDGTAPAEPRVLSCGAAAGSFSRVFGAVFSRCTVDAVELDPAVVELGERWFGGRGAGGEVYSGVDARVFVECTDKTYDVVLVDAYEHQIYVPAHVSSRQFFAAVRRCLAPGGVVAINAGGVSFEDGVVRALGHTMAEVFGEAWAFRVPRSRNFAIFARRDDQIEPAQLRGSPPRAELAEVWRELAAPGAWRQFGRGEPVLDDDRPLLDVLQNRALAVRDGVAELIAMAGDVDPADAEERARAARAAGDWAQALEALGEARQANARLRLAAGDLRWLQRDLTGAAAEYEAARAFDDAALRPYLEPRQSDLAVELAGLARAGDVAARNGWLAWAGIAAGGLAAFFALRAV